MVAEDTGCSLLLQMFVEERGGPEASQGSSLSPSPGLLFPAEASKQSSLLEDGCLLLLGTGGSHANGRDQSPRFREIQRESTEESMFSREGGACRSPGSTGLPLAWDSPEC